MHKILNNKIKDLQKAFSTGSVTKIIQSTYTLNLAIESAVESGHELVAPALRVLGATLYCLDEGLNDKAFHVAVDNYWKKIELLGFSEEFHDGVDGARNLIYEAMVQGIIKGLDDDQTITAYSYPMGKGIPQAVETTFYMEGKK